VRNRGTIGGNCCLNDPTNNLPPLLASLDATFEVQQHGAPARTLPAAEFFLGTLLTVAHGPALLTAITVPVQGAGTRVAYRHQQVGADSWALARAVVRVDVEGDTIVRARVHLGSVPDSPRRLPGVEAALEGATPGAGTVTAALGAFDAEQVETLGDSHGSAAYRLAMTRVQLKRALQEISIPTSAAEEAVA
jgi:carbon-monoxide dehydrogenase medium subunit